MADDQELRRSILSSQLAKSMHTPGFLDIEVIRTMDLRALQPEVVLAKQTLIELTVDVQRVGNQSNVSGHVHGGSHTSWTWHLSGRQVSSSMLTKNDGASFGGQQQQLFVGVDGRGRPCSSFGAQMMASTPLGSDSAPQNRQRDLGAVTQKLLAEIDTSKLPFASMCSSSSLKLQTSKSTSPVRSSS
jgi:hypothetical protein